MRTYGNAGPPTKRGAGRKVGHSAAKRALLGDVVTKGVGCDGQTVEHRIHGTASFLARPARLTFGDARAPLATVR